MVSVSADALEAIADWIEIGILARTSMSTCLSDEHQMGRNYIEYSYIIRGPRLPTSLSDYLL
jgi:hypothetical protein